MRRIAIITVVCVLALFCALYLGDDLIFRLRHSPRSSVTVQHYFAIHQKTSKVELRYDRAVEQPCVHSLFPHSGDKPCWYLKSHTEQWTEI